MLTVGRRWEDEATGFFYYFITGGSEVKEELLSVKPEMQALTVECCWFHTVHKCRKIYFILSYFQLKPESRTYVAENSGILPWGH